MSTINHETLSAKEKVKKALKTLSELAVNYNQKLLEVEVENSKNEASIKELLAKQTALDSIASEFQQLRDMTTHQHKRTTEVLTNLLKELGEIGDAIYGDKHFMSRITVDIKNDKMWFTIAQSYIDKVQSEVTNLVRRYQALKTLQDDCNKKIYEHKRKLANYQRLISQYEACLLALTASMEEDEAHECAPEEDVDSLREECTKLKIEEQTQDVNNKEKD